MTPDDPTDALEAALRSVVDLNGPTLLFEPERLRRSLEARCPDRVDDIALLMTALGEQIPQSLLGAHTDDELQRLLPQAILRLIEARALDPAAARWAVSAWAQAVKLRTAPVAPDPATALPLNVAPLARPTIRAEFRPRWLAVGALVIVALAAVMSFRSGPRDSAASDAPITELREAITEPLAPTPVAARAPLPALTPATVVSPRPVVAFVQLPRAVIAGKPFAISVAYEPADVRIDEVRAKVVDGALRLGAATMRVGTDLSANGMLSVPFEPVADAARGTVEITLVDEAGRASDPKAFVLEVQGAARPAVDPCTVATCGRVVSVRESRDRSGARTWEVIIRMDNRTIHTVVQGTPSLPGDRVRLAGGRFVAMR